MNMFQLAADLIHLLGMVGLLLKIRTSESCAGISLKTQELYVIVFITRYLDLFIFYISIYNTVMKLIFIGSSICIVCYMRHHKVLKHTYNKDLDTFRHYVLVLACFLLAILIHLEFTVIEVLWAFSIYLEAVAVLPQLVLQQRLKKIDNLTGLLVFLLGAYRALYILNWIYRYFTEIHMIRWISVISGIVQTTLYADLFYIFMKTWHSKAEMHEALTV